MPRRFQILCLVSLAIFIAGIRVFSFSEPPEWDIGTYLVIGHELNCGERLYTDVWDSKPPAIFATYSLAERIAGYGQHEIYFLSVAAAIVTMFGIFAAASTQNRAAGLWAALFWACICFEPRTGANLPNTEVFINAALVWGIALVMRFGDESGFGRSMSIGLLLALASMYKQVSVAPAVAIVLALALSRKRSSFQALTIALTGLIVWSLLFGYFAATGRNWIFWQTLFVYPRFYAGSVTQNLVDSFRPENLLIPMMKYFGPLVFAALLVLIPSQRQPARRSAIILLAAAIGTHLAVAWPGHFWKHYYHLWLPILAIAAGWGIDRMIRTSRMNAWYGRALGVAVALALLGPQISWFALDTRGWISRKYDPSLFVRALDDARDLNDLLKPGETFFAWGDEAWIYYQTRRRIPAAALWKHHTLEGPLAEWLSRRTVEQLEANPPDLFIDWELLPSPVDHPITQWFSTRYRALDDDKTRWPFRFYVLRGSELEKRMTAGRTASKLAG